MATKVAIANGASRLRVAAAPYKRWRIQLPRYLFREEARGVVEPVQIPADLAEMISQLSDRERFMLRGLLEAMLQWNRLEVPKKADMMRDLRDTPEYRAAMKCLRREVG